MMETAMMWLGGIIFCCAIAVIIESFNGKPPSKWGWFEWSVIIIALVSILRDPSCRNTMRSFQNDPDDPVKLYQ